MRGREISFLAAVLWTLISISGEQISVDNAPRIITNNGNLIFQAGSLKSIHFETQGNGNIRFNEIDIRDFYNQMRELKSSMSQITNRNNAQCNCSDMQLTIGRNVQRIKNLKRSLKRTTDQMNGLSTSLNALKQISTIDECSSNPCHNGGTCIDGFGKYTCICTKQYQGINCMEDFNECSQLAGTDLGCQNNARCENYNGGFRCICAAKYSGVLCDNQKNGCDGSSNVDLCGHGICIADHSASNTRSFTCLCDHGWSLDPITKTCIVDVDECTAGRYPCSLSPRVPCFNTAGGFMCGHCPSGYSGNGFSCSDVDECLNPSICAINQICINTLGSYKCQCAAGMTVNRYGVCHRQNICQIDNGGCNNNAQCSQNEFSVEGRTCTCNSGYVGFGVGQSGCIIRTETNTTNQLYRLCLRRQTCQNGGLCQPTERGFLCQCAHNFSGVKCEVQLVNRCLQNPCLNSGICTTVMPDDYRCQCTQFFTGTNCETEHSVCGGFISSLTNEQEISLFASSTIAIPYRYPCIWTVIVTEQQFIQVKPITLLFSGTCAQEHVQISEKSPSETQSHELGKYCIDRTQASSNGYNTTRSILIIKAQLQNNVQGRHGFLLRIRSFNYENQNIDCCRCLNQGYVTTGKSDGLFQSPHYPLPYSEGTDCIITYVRPFGQRYKVEISINILHLGESNGNCSNTDFLKISFAESGETKITACNQASFQNRKFITSEFKIQFHSYLTNTQSNSRFQIVWKKTQIYDPCGGIIPPLSTGSIDAPSLSGTEEAYCTWSLHRSNNSQMISLKGSFDNWQNGDCSVYIKIINVDTSGTSRLLLEQCQSTKMIDEINEEIRGELIIIYRKSLGTSTPSFRIRSTNICGKTINMDQFTEIEIKSPNYPDIYDNDLNCVFKLYARTRAFSVDFVDLDITDDYPCQSDYLKIKDATKSFSNGRFCNGNSQYLIPVDKEPSPDPLVIYFRTNSSISGRGFRALVTLKDCGGSYFLSRMLSIAYPHEHFNTTDSDIQYQTNKNCVWNIVSPPGTTIMVIFDEFHLESHDNCNFDSLSISYDNVTKKFCGTSIPNIGARSNKLKLVFKSDYSVSGEGFVLRAFLEPSKKDCHQFLDASDGRISSPSLGSISRPYVCIYTITVPQGRKVVINITIDEQGERNSANPSLNRCFGKGLLRIFNGAVGSTKIADFCPASPQTEETITSYNKASIIYKVPTYGYRSEFNFTIVFRSIDEVCGSIHTDERGDIASPNYPLYAPRDTYCQWEIRIKPGQRIRIDVFHIKAGYITRTRDCHDNKAPIISLISLRQEISISCEKDIEELFFFDDDVRIIFKNFEQTQYRFRLSYKIVCISTLNSFHGRIENTNSITYSRCFWTINILRGSSLVLQFDTFDMPNPRNERCEAYVKVTDAKNTLLEKTCGQTLINNTLQTSNSPVSIIHNIERSISTSILQAHKGFVLEYNTEGCVRNINFDPDDTMYNEGSRQGSISSPQYPNSVAKVDCIWIFKSVSGYSVKLIFDLIELDVFQNCSQGNILEARDSENLRDRSVYSICQRVSSNAPSIYQSSLHYLFLKFSSANSTNGGLRKFHATYEFINSSCEYEITATEGIIKSPNYPKTYPTNIDCRWNIKVRQGMSVHLHFLDFQIEGNSCRYDYVQLFSDLNSESRPMIRLCGNSINSSQLYQSLGNQMLIKFKTDSSVQRRGFQARFFEGCGGMRNATSEKQFLYSPNYPHHYVLTDFVCEWTITANISNPGERIFFYFLGFEGDSSVVDGNCSLNTMSQSDNSLTIIDGSEETPVKARLCSTQLQAPILSSGSFLKVRLRSTNGRAIFKAGFGTGSSTCGGEYYQDNGLFTSPFYPNAVDLEMDCSYIITASPGSQIDLAIDEFVRTNEHPYEYMDFLEIRVGNITKSSLIGRYYSYSDIENATRNVKFNDSLLIRFRSQGGIHTNAIKFLARYHINYLTEFQSEEGVLASPQYGHLYKDDTRMTWTITPLVTQFIDIQFESFSVGRKLIDNDCIQGRLIITDGNDISKSLCGSDIPLRAKYTVPVTITLIAAGFRYSGFLLKWSPSLNESFTKIGNCKYIIQAKSIPQILSSPNFPNFDPINRNCEWRITAPLGGAIELQILNFTLESNCKYENFTISLRGYAISSHSSVFARWIYEERTFCGTQNNTLLDFTKDIFFESVTIKFKVDIFGIFPGFQLSYKLKCHQKTKATEGQLQNDEFPNHMTEFKNCTSIVYVPGNRFFQLNFTSISLPPKRNNECTNGYLEIIAKVSLGKYCGSDIPITLRPLMTNSSAFMIRLVGHFDRFPSYSGYQMKYSLGEVEDCGGSHILTGINDVIPITNPRNHTFSPHFIECRWDISSPYGTKMKIDFVDVFIDGICDKSYLSFFDGSTLLARKIGDKNYCSNVNSLFTTGEKLLVLFRNTNNNAKFRIRISMGSCGGEYHRSSGIITSPNYPHPHPNLSKCIWTVRIAAYQSVVFNFDDVDLNRDCSKTNLTISSTDNLAETNWSSCVNPTNTYIVSSPAKVSFTSTTAGSGRGFKLSYSSRRIDCSSYLTDPSGEGMSKNYPQSMPLRSWCYWIITSDVSKRVTIKIRKLTLGNECLYINDDRYLQIKRICGENLQNYEIDTKSSRVIIYLHSDGGSSLFFSYHTDEPSLCGGHIYPEFNNTGIIYFGGNDSMNYCSHIVHNLPGETGTVVFYVLSTTGLNCMGNFITLKSVVIDATGMDSVVDKGMICNGGETFQTLGKSVNVVYPDYPHSRPSNDSVNLYYKYQNCGGLLTEAFGYISSPNYPNKYPHNSVCEWILKAPNDMHIKINIISLHLENHVKCDYDYLYVRSGPEFDSPPMMMLCGRHNITNETVILRKNVIRLSFKSDSSAAKSGFLIQYTFINAADHCNGFFYGTAGSIKSPNYPRPYPSNLNCNWTIIVPKGYQIGLKFQEPFDLEIDRSGLCTFDSLEIVDSNPDVIITRLCGHIPPNRTILSSGNRMGLVFTSDHNLNLDGFQANYESICGGIFNDSYGSIVSPSVLVRTSDYITQCQYSIPAWKTHLISLWIRASTSPCGYRYGNIEIFKETIPGSYDRHQVICGRFRQPITVLSKESILIKYNATNHGFVQHSFTIQYQHEETTTVYNNITRNQFISTPRFPNPYHHNADLQWKFQAPLNYIFYIEVQNIDIEGDRDCPYDYLAIYYGSVVNSSNQIHKLCGTTSFTTPFKINSNVFMMHFVSDASHFYNHTGFKAIVSPTPGPQLGCGGEIILEPNTVGSIKSVDLNNDGKYENNLFCQWRLIAGQASVINIRFENNSVALEKRNRQQCLYDWLNVYDGAHEGSPLIHSLCGNDSADPITSFGSHIFIVFRTDASVTNRGFKIFYSTLISLNHVYLNATSEYQTVTSPGYPDSTNFNFKGMVMIMSPIQSEHIQLELKEISLRTTPNCSLDSLVIQDSSLMHVNQRRQFCKSIQFQTPFISSDSKVLVMFKIGPPLDENSVASIRYKIDYKIYSCDRTEKAYSGRIINIESLKKLQYSHNITCQLSLEAPSLNLKYQFYFKRLSLERSRMCIYDYIEFTFGRSGEIQYTLPKICGSSLPPSFVSNSSSVTMKFVTDFSVSMEGYDITYVVNRDPQQKCGGDVDVSFGVVTSPGFGRNVYEDGQCTWNIAILSDLAISWKITDLQLGPSLQYGATCTSTTDYVQVTSGESKWKFCGFIPPNRDFETRTSQIIVEYKSIAGGTGMGFRLEWKPSIIFRLNN